MSRRGTGERAYLRARSMNGGRLLLANYLLAASTPRWKGLAVNFYNKQREESILSTSERHFRGRDKEGLLPGGVQYQHDFRGSYSIS